MTEEEFKQIVKELQEFDNPPIEELLENYKNKINSDTMKKYLRFGHIPKDKKSKVHKSDVVVKEEQGVSVWNCAFVNGVPFPLLPQNPSECAMADYFYHLLGDKPVYLVEGTELEERGSVGEPLICDDIRIIKEYTDDYDYLKKLLRRRN